jgi:MFS family permease
MTRLPGRARTGDECESSGANVGTVRAVWSRAVKQRSRDAADGHHRFESARRSLNRIYFVMGLTVIAWVPRFPQIRDQLDVSSSKFGLLLALGTLGAISSTLFMGHAVHRFGSKRILQAGIVTTHAAVAAITFSPNPVVFGAMCIVLSACISAYVVGMNSQSVLLQENLGRQVIARFHGSWSLGALVTGITAGLVAPVTSPQLHVAGLALLLAPIALVLSRDLVTDDAQHARDDEEDELDIPNIFRAPKLTWLLALGAASGSLAEFVNGDWSTIYAHDVLGAPIGRDSFVFTSMTVAVLLGRLVTDRLAHQYGMDRVVRVGGLLIFLGMTLGPTASYLLVPQGPTIALIAACLGFAIAGLGTAPMVPAFNGAAARVQGSPVSVTLARMGVAHQIFIWIMKALIAFTAGMFALNIALLIPAFVGLATIFLARHVIAPVAPEVLTSATSPAPLT